MARIAQTSFTDDEWRRITEWIQEREGMTIYELLKRGSLEFIERYPGKDSTSVPDQIRILVGDLKKYNRKAFDHAANIRWLKGRHGVTESTANEALRIYEVEVLSVL